MGKNEKHLSSVNMTEEFHYWSTKIPTTLRSKQSLILHN